MNTLSPLLSDVVSRLDQHLSVDGPLGDQAIVFGSMLTRPSEAFDVDLAICLPEPYENELGQLNKFLPLLRIAPYGSSRYGSLDVFVQFSNRLFVRDDECRLFVQSRNTKALRKAIGEGCPWRQWRQEISILDASAVPGSRPGRPRP